MTNYEMIHNLPIDQLAFFLADHQVDSMEVAIRGRNPDALQDVMKKEELKKEFRNKMAKYLLMWLELESEEGG